jgi:hypothetical protein
MIPTVLLLLLWLLDGAAGGCETPQPLLLVVLALAQALPHGTS